jgi:hypothetical protein
MAQAPYTSEPFDVVVRLRVEGIEADGENHALSMRLSDPDGKVLVQTLPIQFHVNPPHGTRTLSVGYVFHFLPVVFDRFGEHMIDLAVDRIHLASALRNVTLTGNFILPNGASPESP